MKSRLKLFGAMILTFFILFKYITAFLFKVKFYNVIFSLGAVYVRNYHLAIIYTIIMFGLLLSSIILKRKRFMYGVIIASIICIISSLFFLHFYKSKKINSDDVARVMKLNSIEHGYSGFWKTADNLYITQKDMKKLSDKELDVANIKIVSVQDESLETLKVVVDDNFNMRLIEDKYVFNMSKYSNKLDKIYAQSISQVQFFIIVNEEMVTEGAIMYRINLINSYFARGDLNEMHYLTANQLGIFSLLILICWIIFLCK